MNDPRSEQEEYETDAMEHEENLVLDKLGNKIGNLLIESGYGSIDEIAAADDSELLDINGIGTTALEKIRAKVPALSGVSDQPATVESEVKPVSKEAEAADGKVADLSPSAVEASTADLPLGEEIAIRSLWPARTRVKAPSGSNYEWLRSGLQVNVRREDVEFVMGLNRNVGRACCGSSGERLYFEIA